MASDLFDYYLQVIKDEETGSFAYEIIDSEGAVLAVEKGLDTLKRAETAAQYALSRVLIHRIIYMVKREFMEDIESHYSGLLDGQAFTKDEYGRLCKGYSVEIQMPDYYYEGE